MKPPPPGREIFWDQIRGGLAFLPHGDLRSLSLPSPRTKTVRNQSIIANSNAKMNNRLDRVSGDLQRIRSEHPFRRRCDPVHSTFFPIPVAAGSSQVRIWTTA